MRPESGNADLPLQFQAVSTYTPFFDYFAIKDQNGVTWYWWILASGDIAWGLSVATLSYAQPREVVLSPTPYWLVLVDTTAVTRYVYPDVDTGEILVADSPPSVGTGYTGSPTLQSLNMLFYQIGSTYHGDVRTVEV
jgi:hypothetical protein